MKHAESNILNEVNIKYMKEIVQLMLKHGKIWSDLEWEGVVTQFHSFSEDQTVR